MILIRNAPSSTAAIFLSLSLCACSPEADGSKSGKATGYSPEPVAASAPSRSAKQTAAAASPAAPAPEPAEVSSDIIGLEGLGELRIGRPVPRGSSWAERGAQIGDECRTVSSPRYPGVYAIVTDNKVQRITVGQRSDVKLAEGIGSGASETQVTEKFPGFREEPHKYVAAPAKYLTAPNAGSGGSALRFEIGPDRKVSLLHVGMMPVLGYVEGCA